jgi:hypothetical protein
VIGNQAWDIAKHLHREIHGDEVRL